MLPTTHAVEKPNSLLFYEYDCTTCIIYCVWCAVVKLTFCVAAMARMDDVYLLLVWLLAPMFSRLSDQDAGFNQNLGSYSHA